MVYGGLIFGVSYLMELVEMYNGCEEVMFKVGDMVFVVDVVVDGVRVEDVELFRSERHEW